MVVCNRFYVDGAWIEPAGQNSVPVIDPATEAQVGVVALGSAEDVDRAVAAARAAFASYSKTSRQERIALLGRIADAYERRAKDLALAVSAEMGAPAWLAERYQVPMGAAHLRAAAEILKTYVFEEDRGAIRLLKEPIGVCAHITPWNWPLHQIGCKIAPALAVGCTIVLKPSEAAPFSAQVFAEIMDEAETPAGVFNMVQGDGAIVGAALSEHPDVDMVSFTGSTRAGIEVARAAAPTIKRVHQELGGKSPNIVLRSADLEAAVRGGVGAVMVNSGQSCNAPTRLLVPAERMDEAKRIARSAAEAHTARHPAGDGELGPVVSGGQWARIQELIAAGIGEGATLVAGGPGRPDGLDKGFFVKPTIFADVKNDMRVAREEIFGPVVVIIGYRDEDEAIRIANDTPYGLAAFVQGAPDRAQEVASALRVGQVVLNGADLDFSAPFGGYKQSGNGREWGEAAFHEYLETKAVVGSPPASCAA